MEISFSSKKINIDFLTHPNEKAAVNLPEIRVVTTGEAIAGNPATESRDKHPAQSVALVQPLTRKTDETPTGTLAMIPDNGDITPNLVLNGPDGKPFGKGKPFVVFPLYFRYQRFFMGETPGDRCFSYDAKKPAFKSPFGASNCFNCPKQSGAEKCRFSVVMTFLGGSDLVNLYKFTIKGKAVFDLYKMAMLPQLKQIRYPYEVAFLLDTQQMSNNRHKWWQVVMLDAAASPKELHPHLAGGYAIVFEYYQKLDTPAFDDPLEAEASQAPVEEEPPF